MKIQKSFFFDKAQMDALGEKHAQVYQTASPCPHIHIPNVLPVEVADALYEEFPKPESTLFEKKYDNEHELKLASNNTALFPPTIRHVLSQFNSQAFVSFLEKLTGIDGLIPDPHYVGGGLHQILPGGFLKVHVDFNWHNKLHVERRLNVIFFLNKDWKEEYGGFFELWDKDMTKAEVKILPVFNSMAIFSTSEDSYHGHPDPLACPKGMTRKSLALYYYTSPATDKQARARAHSTVFRDRPGEKTKRKHSPVLHIIKQFIPPIVLSVLKKLRG